MSTSVSASMGLHRPRGTRIRRWRSVEQRECRAYPHPRGADSALVPIYTKGSAGLFNENFDCARCAGTAESGLPRATMYILRNKEQGASSEYSHVVQRLNFKEIKSSVSESESHPHHP